MRIKVECTAFEINHELYKKLKTLESAMEHMKSACKYIADYPDEPQVIQNTAAKAFVKGREAATLFNDIATITMELNIPDCSPVITSSNKYPDISD